MLTIQATVSVLTLTLFNFILQMKDTRIYGYNYSQFIFENVSLFNGHNKKFKVKHSLRNVLILIVLNAVLLFSASYFNFSWAYIIFALIFILSLLMIWKLSSTIFDLVIDQDRFEIEVKDHLRDKLISHLKDNNGDALPKEIKEIKNSCFENIDQHEIQNAQKEAQFILELICDTSLFDAEKILSSFNKMILEISVKFLKEDHLAEVQSFIIDYLDLSEKANIKLDKNYVLLKDFYLKLNRELKFKNYDEIYQLNPFQLISKIYKLYGFDGAQKINLLDMFTLTITQNDELDSKDKNDLLSSLYQIISAVSDKDDLNEIQNDLSMLKTILDSLSLNEIDIFASLLNEILNSSSKNIKRYINLILGVYFYFLFYFKKDLSKEYKEKLKEIKNGTYIKDSSSQSINEFEFPKKIEPFVKIFKFYPFVSKILRQSKWEKVPVINFKRRSFYKKELSHITRKFFIYYMFQMSEIGFKNNEEVFMENIRMLELRKVLNETFNEDGTFKKAAFSEYENFLDLYDKEINDREEVREKSQEFYQFLKDIYKKKHLLNQREYEQDEITSSIEKLKKLLKQEIVDAPLYKLSDCSSGFDLDKNCKQRKIGKITAEILTGDYNLDDYAVNLKDVFISSLIDKLRRKFDALENGFINVEALEKSRSLFSNKFSKYDIDTVVYSETIERYLRRNKFDNLDYDNLIENAQTVDIKPDFNFYINSEKFDFCIDNLKVEINSCSDEYLEKLYNKEQGISAGDIKIEMTREEFFEYMKNREYNIIISYDYYIDLKDDETGFYLGFEY